MKSGSDNFFRSEEEQTCIFLMYIHIQSQAGTERPVLFLIWQKRLQRRALKLLGITDHGPGTLAAGTSSYFRSLSYSPKKRFGIELLFGVELNILDVDGHVDLSDELLDKLDYAIASMHAQNYKSGSVKENTSAYLNAMRHPCVKILGHCDNPHFPADYETLAVAAKEFGVIFEINEASLAPYGYRGDTRSNNRGVRAAAANTTSQSSFPATATALSTSETSPTPPNSCMRRCSQQN